MSLLGAYFINIITLVPVKIAELKNSLPKNKKILNIELYFKLNEFPWSLDSFTADKLDKLLNFLSEDSELELKHIAKLKRYKITVTIQSLSMHG